MRWISTEASYALRLSASSATSALVLKQPSTARKTAAKVSGSEIHFTVGAEAVTENYVARLETVGVQCFAVWVAGYLLSAG